MKDWKETYNLKHYFNTLGSPDLSLIENCWRAVKQYISKYRRHDSSIEDLLNLAIEGWNRIPQETQWVGRFDGSTDGGCVSERRNNDWLVVLHDTWDSPILLVNFVAVRY